VPKVNRPRSEEITEALALYPVFGEATAWCAATLPRIILLSHAGTRLVWDITTVTLRATATALDQTAMTSGALLVLAQVRQVLYDTRALTVVRQVAVAPESGGMHPTLTQGGREALGRLKWLDPVTGLAPLHPQYPTMPDIRRVLQETTWPPL